MVAAVIVIGMIIVVIIVVVVVVSPGDNDLVRSLQKLGHWIEATRRHLRPGPLPGIPVCVQDLDRGQQHLMAIRSTDGQHEPIHDRHRHSKSRRVHGGNRTM